MKNYLYYSNKPGKLLEITIINFDSWGDFDNLIFFIKRCYDIHVVKEMDGPGVRRWILEYEDIQFELIHDDGYGNYFKAVSKDSEKIVNKIAKDIEERFRRGEAI